MYKITKYVIIKSVIPTGVMARPAVLGLYNEKGELRKDEKENSTLSNYYIFGLTTKITPTTCGSITSNHTLSVRGIKLLKYGVDFENCENYKVPTNAQGGDKQ